MMTSPPFYQLAHNAGICSIVSVALREDWMGTRNGEESLSRCLMRSMEHLKDLELLRIRALQVNYSSNIFVTRRYMIT